MNLDFRTSEDIDYVKLYGAILFFTLFTFLKQVSIVPCLGRGVDNDWMYIIWQTAPLFVSSGQHFKLPDTLVFFWKTAVLFHRYTASVRMLVFNSNAPHRASSMATDCLKYTNSLKPSDISFTKIQKKSCKSLLVRSYNQLQHIEQTDWLFPSVTGQIDHLITVPA